MGTIYFGVIFGASRATFELIRTFESSQSKHSPIIHLFHTTLQCNGQFPERIIVFRDGVGDGELNRVQSFEVKQFEDCFHECGADYNPFFGVIIVQKRINTKIFRLCVSLLDILCLSLGLCIYLD